MKKVSLISFYSLAFLQFFAMFPEYFFSVSALYVCVPNYCYIRKLYGKLCLIVFSSVKKRTEWKLLILLFLRSECKSRF